MVASYSPALTRSQARIIWFALAATLAVAGVASVVFALPRPEPGLVRVLLLAASVFVPVDLALSFLVPALTRRRAATTGVPPPEAVAGTQMIVGCALAVGAGLFASVCNLLASEPLFLGLVALCLGAMVAWYPSEARWARLSPRPAAGVQRMMRG